MTERELEEARTRDLSADVREARILVTTGSGGVGKTTTAAAIGLAAVREGRRCLVMTIDPARRLAQAMGLEELGAAPQRIDLADAQRGDGGELWAMMLDMQSTFDALIDRHASSAAKARTIKSNRIYQTLASTLSGTHEYMAMEKLHELHERGEWDLLVIDTPPTRNALDFLDAPKRMTTFLEGRLLRLLLKPGMAAGKGYLRAVNFGATAFMRVAGKVTGMELLDDLARFFRNFEGMYEGFKERAEQVLELLRDPDSRFVVIASPQPPPLREARFFLERLQQEGLHSAGTIVNRIHPRFDRLPTSAEIEKAADAIDHVPTGAALRLADDTRRVAARARRDVNAALSGLAPHTLVEVPLLRSDVHDLATLATIADALTARSR